MSFPNLGGHYNKEGEWVRTKRCLFPCSNCNCMPPNGEHVLPGSIADKKQKEMFAKAMKESGSISDITKGIVEK